MSKQREIVVYLLSGYSPLVPATTGVAVLREQKPVGPSAALVDTFDLRSGRGVELLASRVQAAPPPPTQHPPPQEAPGRCGLRPRDLASSSPSDGGPSPAPGEGRAGAEAGERLADACLARSSLALFRMRSPRPMSPLQPEHKGTPV